MKIPPIGLVGFCDRVGKSETGVQGSFGFSFLGVRSDIVCPIFPIDVSQHYLLFLAYGLAEFNEFEIVITQAEPAGNWTSSFKLQVNRIENPSPADLHEVEVVEMEDRPRWRFFALRLRALSSAVIPAPGLYNFILKTQESPISIGTLKFYHAAAQPLSQATIEAIKSNPNAGKFVQIQVGCPKCQGEAKAYAGIERSSALEKEGFVWFQELPLEFKCSCGATTIDLSYLRSGLHGLLGRPLRQEGKLYSFVRLYERAALETLSNTFRTLIETEGEPGMQVFLKSNPIFFHRYSPRRIMAQAAILTQYRADFLIHSTTGELFLIEIESPQKKLLKSNGHGTAELNHAIDQVADWLHLFGEHRSACLDMLGIPSSEVSALRGVVVIGRRSQHAASALRKLFSKNHGDVSLLTYDDFADSLDAVIDELESV